MKKQVVKTIAALLLAVVMTALGSGCGHRRDYGMEFNLATDCQYSYVTDHDYWKNIQSDGEGQYLMQENFIYYYNTAKKTLVPLCSKPNCLHDKETDMKQRILIAQAMLNDPEILMMDEPTAGLDPSERIRIRNLLSTLSENKIIVIATHIVSDIEFIAKEIVLLRDGEVVRAGQPKQLLTEIRDKVYEIEVGLSEEYHCNRSRITNIRMGANEKIYRVVQDEPPKNCRYQHAKAGLEELYLYYFL